jgi:hypothetical protein
MTTKLILWSLGSMLIFAGYLHFLDATRVWTTYRKINALVTGHDARGGAGFAPIISFQLEGEKYSYVSDVRSDWTARLKVGSNCQILVDPINGNSVLDGRRGYFWTRACAPFVVGILALIGGFFWI